MSTFRDVPADHPLFSEIQWSAEAGLLPAHSEDLFRPDWSVTRSGMALTLYRLSGEPYFISPSLFAYPDVPVDHGLFRMVHWAKERGLMEGHADGTFRPDAALSRGDVAIALYRSAGSPAFSAPAISEFTDVEPTHPAFREIHWLQSKEFDRAYADGSYRPARPMTRAEMAGLLARYDKTV